VGAGVGVSGSCTGNRGEGENVIFADRLVGKYGEGGGSKAVLLAEWGGSTARCLSGNSRRTGGTDRDGGGGGGGGAGSSFAW